MDGFIKIAKTSTENAFDEKQAQRVQTENADFIANNLSMEVPPIVREDIAVDKVEKGSFEALKASVEVLQENTYAGQNHEDVKEKVKRQKEMIRELEHTDVDIVEELEGNPFKIFEWLDANRVANKASKSYKAVLDAFEKLLSCSDEARETAAIGLKVQVELYLNSHSEKAYHLYGRQRYQVMQSLLDNITLIPSMISWQKFLNGANGDKETDKKKVDITSEKEAALQKEWKAIQEERNINKEIVSKPNRVFINLLKAEGNAVELSAEEKEKNKKWNIGFVETAEEYSNAVKENASVEVLDAIKEKRRVYLNSLAEDLLSVTEEEIELFISSPKYFSENYERYMRLSQIATWASDSTEDIDAWYLEEDPMRASELWDKGLLMFYAKCQIANMKRYVSDGQYDLKELSTRKSEYDLYRKAKEKAFVTSYRRKLNVYKESKVEEEKAYYDYYAPLSEKFDFLEKKGMNSAVLMDKAMSVFNQVEKIISGFGNETEKDKGTTFSAPSLDEAWRIVREGTIQEKYALHVVFNHIVSLVPGQEFNADYRKVRDALYKGFGRVHKDADAKTDENALSKDDLAELTLTAWSHSYMCSSKYIALVKKDITLLENEAKKEGRKLSDEERNEAIKSSISKHANERLSLYWDGSIGALSVKAAPELSECLNMLGEMTECVPGMKVVNEVKGKDLDQIKKTQGKFVEEDNSYSERKRIAINSMIDNLRRQKIMGNEDRFGILDSLNEQIENEDSKFLAPGKLIDIKLAKEAERKQIADNIKKDLIEINKKRPGALKPGENPDDPAIKANHMMDEYPLEIITKETAHYMKETAKQYVHYHSYFTPEQFEKINKGRTLFDAFVCNFRPVQLTEDGKFASKQDQINDKKNRDWVKAHFDKRYDLVMKTKISDFLKIEFKPEMMKASWIFTHPLEVEYMTNSFFCHENNKNTYKEYKNAYNALPDEIKELADAKDKLFSLYQMYIAYHVGVYYGVTANTDMYFVFTQRSFANHKLSMDNGDAYDILGDASASKEKFKNETSELIQKIEAAFNEYNTKIKAYAESHV